jgi:CHAD domain-containing protein
MPDGLSIDPAMPMHQAAPLIIMTLHDALQETHAAIMAHHDDKALHDFRVALRRCRAVLREISCVDQDSWQPILQVARSIAQSTNLMRDVDVCRADLLQYPDITSPPGRALLRHLSARKARSMQLVNKELGRVPTLLLQPLAQLAQKTLTGPCSQDTFGEVALRIIKKRSTVLLRDGSKLKPKSAAWKYHRVRIRAKRLRYTLENLAPAVEGTIPEQLLGPLKKLQNNLGTLQDIAVQGELLDIFAARTRTQDPASVKQFIEARKLHLKQRKHELRQEYTALFQDFMQKARSLQELADEQRTPTH